MHHEALQYAEEQAERTFAQVLAFDLDLARLALVKAYILNMLNRTAEAIVLARQAAEGYLELRDRPRYVDASITEAAMLYSAGAVQQALDVSSAPKGDSGLDAIEELHLTYNNAIYLCELGRAAEAVAPLEHCVAEYSRLDMVTERTRSQWCLGNALLGTISRTEERFFAHDDVRFRAAGASWSGDCLA